MEDGKHCKCGQNMLLLLPGELCEICGRSMPEDLKERVVEEFYYQSKVYQDEDGKYIWQKCVDEAACKQMNKLGFTVKKIVRKVMVVR